jgi:hypothetical protein
MREDSTMRLSTIGLLLTLSILVTPLAVQAQPPGKVYRIGFLYSYLLPLSEPDWQQRSPFFQALQEMRALGWMEGHNIVSEYRSAERQLKSLPALAMELVQLKVDLIVADGSIETRAAKQATSTIPIVMIAPVEAVKTRLVASLMLPWRKIGRSWTSGSTGTEISGRDLIGKRPLHRLIDFAASELESYQKGCRKRQGWKPAKSKSFLQRFGRSERISFLIDKSANALYSGSLVKPDSASLALYR